MHILHFSYIVNQIKQFLIDCLFIVQRVTSSPDIKNTLAAERVDYLDLKKIIKNMQNNLYIAHF